MKESRSRNKKIYRESFENRVITMGLLEKYEIVTEPTGEPKNNIYLNKKVEIATSLT
jgi:hypothetical protein